MDIDNTEDTSLDQSEETSTVEGSLDYEEGVKLSDKISANPDLLDKGSVPELEKLDKFRYRGKEYTAKDLEKTPFFHSDYTKKTQALAEERKFYENLPYDLEVLKSNPSLADKFKSIYPEKFHWALNYVLGEQASTQNTGGNSATAEQAQQKIAEVKDPRIDELYESYQSSQREAAQARIDSMFDRNLQKYPHADEVRVIGTVQALYEAHAKDPQRYPKPDEKMIEKVFQKEHESMLSRFKQMQSSAFKNQQQANAEGAMTGAGGAIPGRAPYQPRTLKEATELALKDPYFS
jgi:hypothetical protein